MVLLALPPADHLLIERDRGQFVPFRRRANVRVERLLKIPAEPSPELRIPGAAAQTRVVSMAGIRLGSILSSADSRDEAESAHHPARCLPSSICLGRLSPTYSSRNAGLKSRISFSAISSILL